MNYLSHLRVNFKVQTNSTTSESIKPNAYWKNYRGNKYHTGSSRNNGPLKNILKFKLALNYNVDSSPAVDSLGNIYFGNSGGDFFKVSPNGSYFWINRAISSRSAFISSPAFSYNEDMVYCSNQDGWVYAFSTSSGTITWKHIAITSLVGSPYIYGEGLNAVVLIGGGGLNSNVWCINATNGTLLWTQRVGAGIDYSSPVVFNNTVFIGSKDFNVYSIDMLSRVVTSLQKTGNSIRYKLFNTY